MWLARLGALIFMRPLPLKVLGYNPLSMNCQERILDIMEEAAGFYFTLVAGTCMRAVDGGIPKREQNGAMCISEGYIPSSMSNKSCGTSIIVGKRFGNA